MVRKGREKYRLEEKTEAYFVYFQDGQNWIELAFYGCILTVAGLRLWAEAAYDATRLDEFSGRWVQLLDFCRALYAVAVVLGFYRYIEVMKVYESLGVIYIALQSMYADIGNWITINGFIILGFGVAFTVLMPGEAGKSDFEYDKPFWKSLRALLGDFDVSGVFDYYESAPMWERCAAVATVCRVVAVARCVLYRSCQRADRPVVRRVAAAEEDLRGLGGNGRTVSTMDVMCPHLRVLCV